MPCKTIVVRTMLAAAAAMLVTAAGCSFSKSSSGISDSISSPSRWSSESSSPEKEKKYLDEVADFTAAFVRSAEEGAPDMEAFRRGIAEIAEKVGVVNWEAQSGTYVGIGKGLRKAGVEGTEYEDLKKELTGADYGKMQDVEKGYRSED